MLIPNTRQELNLWDSVDQSDALTTELTHGELSLRSHICTEMTLHVIPSTFNAHEDEKQIGSLHFATTDN